MHKFLKGTLLIIGGALLTALLAIIGVTVVLVNIHNLLG